jgi:hypothetical protein
MIQFGDGGELAVGDIALLVGNPKLQAIPAAIVRFFPLVELGTFPWCRASFDVLASFVQDCQRVGPAVDGIDRMAGAPGNPLALVGASEMG